MYQVPSTKYQVFTLNNIQAPNFLMTPLELKDYLDFEVNRIYLISHPTGDTGQHAHPKLEDELFVQLQGECTIVVDDGTGLKDIRLIGGKNAIYIPHMVWHGFKDQTEDSIILALTSTNYDPTRADYVEDYKEFKELCKNQASS